MGRLETVKGSIRSIGYAILLLLGSGAGSGCHRGAGVAAFAPDSIPEAYRLSSAALMYPGSTRAFRVTPEGNLYNGAWDVLVRPAVGGELAQEPRTIAYEERWRPVVRWTRWNDDVRWEFEAVALPEPAPRDTGLFVSLEVTAHNEGDELRQAKLEIVLRVPDGPRAFVAFDAPAKRRRPLRWGSIGARDTVHGWGPGRADGALLTFELPVDAHEQRSARVVLSAYPATAPALADWARPPHRERVTQTRRHWDRSLAAGTRFELGDPEVENALRAARVVLLALRERRGRDWVPIGGPFHYRDVWLRDGARAVYALAVSGHVGEARALARGLSHFQWPNGAYLSQRGQLDGTGQALWAFEQAFLRPAPDESTAVYARAARRAVRWIEWQRDLGRQRGWPFGTMLPFGDPRDAELLRAQLVGNDAWAIAGYRSAERLLRAAGEEAQADSVASALQRYEADFVEALDRTASPDVPPAWQPGGRDWGNLAVGWPCAALHPRNPRCFGLARRVWSTAGGAGLVSYGPPDSAHYYLGADLGTWALLAGLRESADSVLTELLSWRSASGTACEIFSRGSRDFGANLTPHPTSAAALIALVRNTLVEDHADTLRLTLGARSLWWRGSRVSGAPTRWGNLDLSFSRRGDQATWDWTAVPVWTELTLPPGVRRLDALPGPLREGSRPDRVMAPPGTGSARVRVAPV